LVQFAMMPSNTVSFCGAVKLTYFQSLHTPSESIRERT
jgi:hypothetical protein